MKNIIFIIIFILIANCSGFNDVGKVLRNEKTATTDEFLVKKRKPLVLPPDFNEIPEPGTMKSKVKNEEEIKNLLKISEEKNSNNINSSLEESVLNKIRK
tara:strand:+ start:425 stop:724 length:300 start_codon:yes stop_codon:yes gene_type:complete